MNVIYYLLVYGFLKLKPRLKLNFIGSEVKIDLKIKSEYKWSWSTASAIDTNDECEKKNNSISTVCCFDCEVIKKNEKAKESIHLAKLYNHMWMRINIPDTNVHYTHGARSRWWTISIRKWICCKRKKSQQHMHNHRASTIWCPE